MTTDYIFFVHGVKSRDQQAFEDSCNAILQNVGEYLQGSNRRLEPIYLFWGNLNVKYQTNLVDNLKKSPQWQELLFQEFRSETILPFVGDAALYLSRHVGAKVVYQFRDLILEKLQHRQPGDRLHLVTHSLGTVILFDILFAERWEDPHLNQQASTTEVTQAVMQIREVLFGLEPKPKDGLEIASIHTMGSPLALFSLLSVTGESSHALAPNLCMLLQNLYYGNGKRSLPWYNYLHPADPIAYTLQGVIPTLFGEGRTAPFYVHVRDVITEHSEVFLTQDILPLLWGGSAHESYWQSQAVAKTIAETIALPRQRTLQPV
jgi:hypothetical protein